MHVQTCDSYMGFNKTMYMLPRTPSPLICRIVVLKGRNELLAVGLVFVISMSALHWFVDYDIIKHFIEMLTVCLCFAMHVAPLCIQRCAFCHVTFGCT